MLFAVIMFACSNDDNPQNSLQDNFIDIENGEFNEGTLPVGDNENMIQSTSFDNKALPGGSSYLEINSTEELDYLNVSVKGESGYIKVKLNNPETLQATARANNILRYTVIVSVSQNLEGDFTLEYTIVNKKGEISPKFKSDVEYIKAGTGLLQINLRFSNDKDIDLHVEEPNGNMINYMSIFPYMAEEYDKFFEWMDDENISDEEFEKLFGRVGLDIDSNAGCAIDGINSENIFFEKDCMQKGKYNVYVNMFANCDPSIATNYTIRVIYKGKEIASKEGRFEVGAESNGSDKNKENLIKVLDFTIDEGINATSKSRATIDKNNLLIKGEYKLLINK